jgi:hypothetical protein
VLSGPVTIEIDSSTIHAFGVGKDARGPKDQKYGMAPDKTKMRII